MGFLDWFTGGEEGQIKRHVKRVSNLNAQVEDREISAQWLAEHGSEQAILGLLNRFNVNYEQRMKDAKEKEAIYGLLLDKGPFVVDPLRKWLRANQNFALPFNAYEHHAGEDAAVGLLLEMVAAETDPFKTEKKRQILIKLAEYQDERIVEGAAPLLADFDEGVRYAAAEALISQEARQDAIRGHLARVLGNPEEESNRLRVRIAEVFQKRGWPLGEFADAVAAHPPQGWTVDDGRLRPA